MTSSAISLTYACGCRDVFGPVSQCHDDQVDQRCTAPCIPETCQTCAERGRPCTGRENLYRPVEWTEINGGPRRVIRMPRTGSLAWERSG